MRTPKALFGLLAMSLVPAISAGASADERGRRRLAIETVAFSLAADYFAPLDMCRGTAPEIAGQISLAIDRHRKEFPDVFEAVESDPSVAAAVSKIKTDPQIAKLVANQDALIKKCKIEPARLNELLDDPQKRELTLESMARSRQSLGLSIPKETAPCWCSPTHNPDADKYIPSWVPKQ